MLCSFFVQILDSDYVSAWKVGRIEFACSGRIRIEIECVSEIWLTGCDAVVDRRDECGLTRMTGYSEADIEEYLENSFEEIIWEWGYMNLIL